ncbi:hypothetical protein [Thiohalocapsa sp.]|jgi:hypothetical protein|nr:hypothetical protein [Thiohalocapsa sp.]
MHIQAPIPSALALSATMSAAAAQAPAADEAAADDGTLVAEDED